jgi:hypothetical protein
MIFRMVFKSHKIGEIAKIKKNSLTPSFIEIAPAVVKHVLLTDDDDGRHIIAAHQRRAKNSKFKISKNSKF